MGNQTKFKLFFAAILFLIFGTFFPDIAKTAAVSNEAELAKLDREAEYPYMEKIAPKPAENNNAITDPETAKLTKDIAEASFIGRHLVGKHQLAPLETENGELKYLARNFFPEMADVVNSTPIKLRWQIFYRNNTYPLKEKVYSDSTIPYGLIKVVFNEAIEIPFIKFKWRLSEGQNAKFIEGQEMSLAEIIKHNVIYIELHCRKEHFPFRLISTNTDRFYDSYVGQILKDIHLLEAVSFDDSKKPAYFFNASVKDCPITTDHTLIGFKWFSQLHNRHIYSEFPACKFELVETEECKKPFVLFYWIGNNDTNGKEIGQLVSEHVSGIKVFVKPGEWPFLYKPQTHLQRYSKPEAGNEYADISELIPFGQNPNLISMKGEYFRAKDDRYYVNEYSEIQFQFIRKDKKTIKLESIDSGRLKIVEIADKNFLIPIIQFQDDGIVDGKLCKATIYCPEKTWPFEFHPDGNYQELGSDVEKDLLGEHQIATFETFSEKNTIILRNDYFRRKGDTLALNWLSSDRTMSKPIFVKYNTITLDFQENQKIPVISLKFNEVIYNNSDPNYFLENCISSAHIKLKRADWEISN